MGDVILANGFDWPTAQAGGANYLWYALGPECDREPYGLIPNYDQPGVRGQAQQQLATMHARGMRTLAIGIGFINGFTTGTLIDAGNPAQVSQSAQNLHALLLDIQAAGFERVLFRFFPQGNMSPSSNSFDPATIDLYWGLIQAMHAELSSTFLPYLTDLGVEGAPADKDSVFCDFPPKQYKWQCPANKAWSNAAREIWRRYRQTYGVSDTVGFSFITTTDAARRRVRHMKYVYDGVYPGAYPAVLAMDFYGDPGYTRTEGDQFINMAGLVDDYSADYGFSVSSFIISETWNNDPLAAVSLSSAIAASGQPVSFLAEWPLERGGACADTGVNVPPPYEFDIYQMYGF